MKFPVSLELSHLPAYKLYEIIIFHILDIRILMCVDFIRGGFLSELASWRHTSQSVQTTDKREIERKRESDDDDDDAYRSSCARGSSRGVGCGTRAVLRGKW